MSDWSFSTQSSGWHMTTNYSQGPQIANGMTKPCACSDCDGARAPSRPSQSSTPSGSGLPGLPNMFLSGNFAQTNQLLSGYAPSTSRLASQPTGATLPSILPNYGATNTGVSNFLAPSTSIYSPYTAMTNATPSRSPIQLPQIGSGLSQSVLNTGREPNVPQSLLGGSLPSGRTRPDPDSPRRRSQDGEVSPQPGDRSASGGESGNDERIDTPTPFINKLFYLLTNPEYPFIRWSDDGRSFVFAANSPDLAAAFAQVFRHRNINSFVRQLNIYNFKRLSGVELHNALPAALPGGTSTSDWTGFRHDLFYSEVTGRTCDLGKIKPTKGKHYSATRRMSGSNAPLANGSAKAHDLKAKGKVGGAVAGIERKFSA
ncbi:hypothetical protein BMF94_5499 [Rhodotorula taiwanensis]|uniref:HSF-type DNA-binding domain-containing protein n=1 Tax=Rhodotorula taiwanensis TaxID=741276 RepID=A0A2S5B325_9BASI|nr:hypothetical protein BMF94_5499 [Rhodotorula taiwanensis]